MNNNQNKLINEFDKSTSFIDVFKKLKNIIKNEIHVATLGLYKSTQLQYDETRGYGIINIVPFPLNKNEISSLNQCYYFKEEVFNEDQLLLIVYTDIDFKTNLDTNKSKSIVNENPAVHSKMSAVLVSTTNVSAKSLIVFDSNGNIIFKANSLTNTLIIDSSYLSGNINVAVLPNLEAVQDGTDKTVVTTGEKYSWNNKLDSQEQADWNQTNAASPDYIKNKPTTMTGTFDE